MSASASASHTPHGPASHGPAFHGPASHGIPPDAGKRDFLQLAAGSAAAITIGTIARPLVDSMSPSADAFETDSKITIG